MAIKKDKPEKQTSKKYPKQLKENQEIDVSWKSRGKEFKKEEVTNSTEGC